MKKNLITAVLMTAVTTVLLGLIYPLAITAIAQGLFPHQANGQIIVRDGQAVASRIIGQPFTGDDYFHSRPSAAGSGYDADNSGGSNLGPSSRKLIAEVEQRAQSEKVGVEPVPVDLVTASASGLDPDITPAAAEYQVPRVAHARGVSESDLRNLVAKHIEQRQLGFVGEPRVNVVELNLDLDSIYPLPRL